MLGETPREEKLAVARKKLKHFQKKKEAEKVKSSSSRQSTPDSQVDLITSNGKEFIHVEDEDTNSVTIPSNIIINERLPDKNMEVINKNVANQELNQGDSQNEETNSEISSVNGITNTESKIADVSALPSTCHDSNNHHSSINSYYSDQNDTRDDNKFEEISLIHTYENVDTFLDIPEEPKPTTELVQEIKYSELPCSSSVTDFSVSQVQMSDQVEVHMQTISILVTEKSELESELRRNRQELKNNCEELCDLKSKLDSSQSELNLLQSSHSHLTKEFKTISETIDKSSMDYSLLNAKLDQYRSSSEDLKSMIEELNVRLSKECNDKSQITEELGSTKCKLELANIHIQQLRDSSNEELAKEISSLKEFNSESQKQIESLKSNLEQAGSNKASIEQEYKAYGNHLVAQLEAAYLKLSQNEQSMQQIRQSNLELETKLASIQNKNSVPDGYSVEEFNKINKLNQDLSNENSSLKQNFTTLELDNKALSKMCVEQRESLERMEVMAEQKNSNEVDTSQLLQSMQSDKVAAARALSQNKQLKEQLEELQNGFIMMSNKKLELTEKLEVEVHFRKRLQKEMLELNDHIELYSKISGQKKEKINSGEIKEDSKLMDVSKAEKSDETPKSELNPDTALQNTDAAIQLNVIDDNIIEEARKYVVEACNNEVIKDESMVNPTDWSNYVNKETHLALENRFTRCMRDLAAAQDEKQNLDHLVQRLQLETEAVGDYITIYQFQRGVMKKEVEGLNNELCQLKAEKEKMHHKLASVQNLVGHLTGVAGPSEKILPEGEIKSEEDERSSSVVDYIGENPSETQLEEEKHDKKHTVRKIMDLISEMESTSQTDVTVLSKFHHCPLCSGKLINV